MSSSFEIIKTIRSYYLGKEVNFSLDIEKFTIEKIQVRHVFLIKASNMSETLIKEIEVQFLPFIRKYDLIFKINYSSNNYPIDRMEVYLEAALNHHVQNYFSSKFRVNVVLEK